VRLPRVDRAAASPDLGSSTVTDKTIISRIGEEAPDGAPATTISSPVELTICLGSRVKVENLSEGGRKLVFTLAEESDLENGKLGIHSPLGQALLDAQVGDEVEYQVDVHVKEVRVLEITEDEGLTMG
jgi:transcription elongation GreA/GreB family factor